MLSWVDVNAQAEGKCDRRIASFWRHVDNSGVGRINGATMLEVGDAIEASGEWTSEHPGPISSMFVLIVC